MGFFDTLHHLFNRADFWDKQENANQDAAYAAQQEEERKRRQQQQAQQAAQQAASQNQLRQQQQQTISSLTGNNNPLDALPRKPDVNQLRGIPQIDNSPATRPFDRAVNTAADVTANVASGAAEGVARIAGLGGSVRSYIARSLGANDMADRFDQANDPARIANSIAASRKEVDDAVRRDGSYQRVYQPAAVATNIALAVPTLGASLAPTAAKLAPKAPRIADGLDKIATATGGHLLNQLHRARTNFLDVLQDELVDAGRGAGVNGVDGAVQTVDDLNRGLDRKLPVRELDVAPPSRPARPEPTEPVQVAPGVTSPNLTRIANQPPTPPVVEPPTVPATPPTLPSLERALAPAQGAVPTNVTHPVPTLQTINPEIQKAVDKAVQQMNDTAELPPVKPPKQTVVPVETPIKAASKEAPQVVTPPQEVITRQMTPEEMAAKGMSQEQIDAVMARRANPESVAKPEPKAPTPEETAAATERARAEAQAAADSAESPERLAGLRDRHENSNNREERGLLARLIRAEEQGGGTPAKERRLGQARNEMADFDEKYPDGAPDQSTPTATKTVAPAKTTAPVSAVPKKSNVAQSVKAEPAPEIAKPTVNTATDLQKGARDNTTKSGKVSQRWINQQRKNGADPEELRSAIEKVQGRQGPLTAKEKATQTQRAEANTAARERKKAAAAEGKTKQAAPAFAKAQARKLAQEADDKELRAIAEKNSRAYVKPINIDETVKAATDEIDNVSDVGIGDHLKQVAEDIAKGDDPADMVRGTAAMQRLDRMVTEGKITDDDLLKMSADIMQSQAVRSSLAGQTNRIVREIYQKVPAPVRVTKELDKLVAHYEKLGKEFKPSEADKAELIAHTRNFDKAVVDLNSTETKMQTAMADILDTTTPMKSGELKAAVRDYEQLVKEREAAQQAAVEASGKYASKLNEIKPALTGKDKLKDFTLSSPDHAGNYLRQAMLSAPSGRVRDAISTGLNVADQFVWRSLEAIAGKTSNTLFKTNLTDTLTSGASLKKGARGALNKVRSSYKGESTLDEATGRTGFHDRSELGSKDSISTFKTHNAPSKPGKVRSALGTPKKLIRSFVQAPTDLTYGIYTDSLHAEGLRAAKGAGLNGERAKVYARMFMEQPDQKSVVKAASRWLENSGMQDNFVSRGLTKFTDWLDHAGSNPKTPTATRFVQKATARVFRTTTIPFAQYMGGATHAMLVNQNPLVNVGKTVVALAKKDPQAAVEQLARGGWNTAKIASLNALISSNTIKTSDTDADGKANYNGPYVVTKDGKYIPASTYGIAAGTAIISAHYLNKAISDLKNGDLGGVIANSTIGPFWATLRASGMDNALSGDTVLAGMPSRLSETFNNSNKDAKDAGAVLTGGVIGDLGSQGVPAVFRDIDSFMNQNKQYNPTGEAPDTSGKDPVTGRVNPIQKGIAQVKAGIPGLSNDLPRKSGYNARTFNERVFNANRQSEQQAGAIADKQKQTQAATHRSQVLFSDKTITGLLNKENRAIYDKYKGDMTKASPADQQKVWSAVKKSKDTLLDNSNYDAYGKVLQQEYEESKTSGTASKTDLEKQQREITRISVAGKAKVDPQIYRLYTGKGAPEGGGITQSEFAKLMDPDDASYDPDTAGKLWALDQALAKAGVSANTNGLNPWTRTKFNVPKNGWGSGGSGKDQMATDFGTVKSVGSSSTGDQAIKAIQLSDFNDLVPNLAKQAAHTSLKKKISVSKGVKL